MPNSDKSHSGHRQRLRERFLASGAGGLPEPELLELLLTYAIPRRDVAPLAGQLLVQFGNLPGVLAASHEELLAVPGIGERAAILIEAVAQFVHWTKDQEERMGDAPQQPPLFETEPDLGPLFGEEPGPQEAPMRTFANDEIANSLTFVPQAAGFESYEAFRVHLQERLPYNSESTRRRRASEILKRFFPGQRLNIPLTYYASNCTNQADLKPAIFYHVLKAEPLAAKVAEELVWPALPTGRVEREDMREFILRYLPDIGASSQTNALRSLFTTYDLLSVGTQDGTTLRFQVHRGTLEAFLYVLTAEFPEPGMYRFEELEEGPMRHWLLWDREWMHQQLYNLRDLGILSKISQIDALRQFTLQDDQWTALRRFFEHPERGNLALREGARNPVSEEKAGF
jgi:DNA repair protein RadC